MARAFRDVDFNVTSIKEEFPFRNKVPDEELIPWLSSKAGKNGVWITADEDAQKTHAKLILQEGISTIWIFRPKKGLSALQELQLVSYVIEKVEELVLKADQPLHFRASFNVMKPTLKRLSNTLMDKILDWKNVSLE